jgi:DNA repair exonuclease SbcCD ATPase subunit
MTDFFSLLDVSSLYPKLAEYHIENLVPDLLVLQKSCQTILMQPNLSVGQSGTVSTDIVSTQQEWKVNAEYVNDEVTSETISLLTQIKVIIGLMDSIAKTAKVAPTKATLVAALNYLVSRTEKCQEALNSFSNFVEAQAKERETKQAELSKEVTEHLQSLQSSQGEIEELRNKIRAVNSRVQQLIKTIVSDGARVGEMIGEIFKPVVELISKLPSGGKASQETKALSIMEFQAKADTVDANQNFENITSIEEGNEELRRLYNRLASLNMLVTKLTILQEQASAYSGSLSGFAGYVTGTKTKIHELLCGLKQLREDLNNDNESSVPAQVEMRLNMVNHKWQEIGATIALHQQTLSGVN